MRSSRRRTERMRAVVDCLPYETKLAMLDGLDRYDIIAGAYSDRNGRVCPMLAAHRCGGRTDFRSFARAWDRFTGVGKRARQASERELRTLRAHLESSVWKEELERDRLTHQPARRLPEAQAKSQPSPAMHSVGAWLIPFRSLDSYLAALAVAQRQFESGSGGEPSQPDRQPVAAASSNS
jgi:hypothetical protein